MPDVTRKFDHIVLYVPVEIDQSRIVSYLSLQDTIELPPVKMQRLSPSEKRPRCSNSKSYTRQLNLALRLNDAFSMLQIPTDSTPLEFHCHLSHFSTSPSKSPSRFLTSPSSSLLILSTSNNARSLSGGNPSNPLTLPSKPRTLFSKSLNSFS